ncbi:hypothetical protein ACJX0J_038141, partial [Zea mays]
ANQKVTNLTGTENYFLKVFYLHLEKKTDFYPPRKELDTTNAYRQKVMNNYTSVCIVNHNLEENNYTSCYFIFYPKKYISAQNILQSHISSSISIWRTIIPMIFGILLMHIHKNVCIVNHNLEENNYTSCYFIFYPKNRYQSIIPMFEVITKVVSAFQDAHVSRSMIKSQAHCLHTHIGEKMRLTKVEMIMGINRNIGQIGINLVLPSLLQSVFSKAHHIIVMAENGKWMHAQPQQEKQYLSS